MCSRDLQAFILAAILACALSASACGGSSSPVLAAPTGTLSNGFMSASIAGLAWNADALIGVTYVPEAPHITISGHDLSGRTVGFGTVLTVARTGTYTVNNTNIATFVVELGAQHWSADPIRDGTGTLTFTTFTTNRLVGTFSFTAYPDLITGATGAKDVTNGRFDITY